MYHSVLCRVERVVDGLGVDRMSFLGTEIQALGLIAEEVRLMKGYVLQEREALEAGFIEKNFKKSLSVFRESVESLKDSLRGTDILSVVMAELDAISSLLDAVNEMTISSAGEANALLDRMSVLGTEVQALGLIAEEVGLMKGYVLQERQALKKGFIELNFKHLFSVFRESVDLLKKSLRGTASLSSVMAELEDITSLVNAAGKMTISDAGEANTLLDRMKVLVDNIPLRH